MSAALLLLKVLAQQFFDDFPDILALQHGLGRCPPLEGRGNADVELGAFLLHAAFALGQASKVFRGRLAGRPAASWLSTVPSLSPTVVRGVPARAVAADLRGVIGLPIGFLVLLLLGWRVLRRGPENEGDQVRLRMVVLPEPAARPRHVEVAEARRRQPTSPAHGADEPVHSELGAAVRVGRQGRSCLLYGHLLWLTVDSGRRRKDEPPCIRFTHRLQEVERPADVVAVVDLRLLYGLANEGECREVEHAVEAFGEHLTGKSGVHEVSLEKAGPFGDGLTVSFGEVVEDDRFVARFDELGGDDATDVASPSCHQDLHEPSIFPRRFSALTSGRTSMMKAPAPVSLPARYFSLSAVRFGG